MWENFLEFYVENSFAEKLVPKKNATNNSNKAPTRYKLNPEVREFCGKHLI